MEHVTKSYGRRRVLDDIDLLLPTGSFNLLVGPNGSGKTTLLRIASTYARPTQGQVHWGQGDGTETSDARVARPRIGYAGHVPLLYDELSTREHLEFALRMRGASKSIAGQGAAAWTSAFEVASRQEERVETLSRGLRQRVALAQAFAVRPEFLLLDEPASNLDARGLEVLVDQLRQVRRASTVLIATHDPDPFRPLADRVLEVKDAKVQLWGERP